jgi:low temperature requirement protein LtrA
MLLAVWWVWVLIVWLTDLFDPRLPIIQNLVVVAAVGVIVIATAMPYAYLRRGLVFVLAYFAIHLARHAVVIPATRVNREIQARSIRVAFWLGVSAVPWLAGAFTGSLARLLLWALAVVISYGSARIGWPTPGLGRTDPADRIFNARHLAERHRQIIIVAFGELILTSSTGLAYSAPTASRIAVFALSIGSAVLLFGTCLFERSVTGRFSWARAIGAPAALAVTPAVYLQPVWMIMLAVDAILLLTLIAEELIKRFRSGRSYSSVK